MMSLKIGLFKSYLFLFFTCLIIIPFSTDIIITCSDIKLYCNNFEVIRKKTGSNTTINCSVYITNNIHCGNSVVNKT